VGAELQLLVPADAADPDLVLIRVGVERAEYWVAPDLTWPFVAQFVVLALEQQDDPEYHARIVFPSETSSHQRCS